MQALTLVRNAASCILSSEPTSDPGNAGPAMCGKSLPVASLPVALPVSELLVAGSQNGLMKDP
tara:strand:- start:21 stop:209 length:189 start_codon:yes stop_codon:yes gene_type:complete